MFICKAMIYDMNMCEYVHQHTNSIASTWTNNNIQNWRNCGWIEPIQYIQQITTNDTINLCKTHTHTQTHKKNKCEKGWMNAVNSTNRPPWLFHYPLLGSGHWSFKSQWLLWHASWWIRQQWFTIAKRHLSGWRKTEFRPHNSPRKERKEVQRCWSKASRRDGLIKNQLDHFLANKQVPVNTFQ